MNALGDSMNLQLRDRKKLRCKCRPGLTQAYAGISSERKEAMDKIQRDRIQIMSANGI